MQRANCLVSLGGDHGNTVPKWLCTAAEIAVLREIHGDDAVNDIEPIDDIKRSNREERGRLLAIYGGAKYPDQKPIVESMFPGVAARVFESLDELGLDESFFKATGRLKARPAAIDPNSGPTIAEWVAHGYAASGYPPSGYNSKSTQEEIDAAIAAEQPTAPAWNADASAPEGDESDEAEEGVGDDINDEHAEKDILG